MQNECFASRCMNPEIACAHIAPHFGEKGTASGSAGQDAHRLVTDVFKKTHLQAVVTYVQELSSRERTEASWENVREV